MSIQGELAPHVFLRSLFDRAVAVADPMRALAAHLPARPPGRVVVIGAGKASARMAEAVEAVWGPCEGLVITRYGYARPCEGIEIVEAAHPVPDEAGEAATKRMLELLKGLGEGDFVLALISGGASSLLVQGSEEVTLADKQAVHTALLTSGAPIGQMNIVRKHMSAVKGGKLAAAAYPAEMLSLMISDVPGDDPAQIGSGPTVGDGTAPADARALLARWNIKVPESIRLKLMQSNTVIAPDDAGVSRVENRVIAAPSQSLAAAAELARAKGFDVKVLGDALEGEARVFAHEQAELALRLKSERQLGDPPLLLLSGGELTVTRTGTGVGGPNAEYCLALAMEFDGADGIYALACDTDGVDGSAEVAGAYIAPDSLSRALALGSDPVAALANNDAHRFFEVLGNQVITGPTLTNVNDFRAILIL
ncbi:glycerate kinase [Roseovarius faecimaris]|uniref:Glycerate kinase n=1 Tax=Roseovarius faecimaris TaxID=2494550 RepID=A0A6I6IR70_9RHOB|nr:glycerate kinase [Roseovarius faecimaris]QGX99579.1 glycerate kinase [Roseovarius faecimaris]